MIRLRRSRLFLILAAVAVLILYQFTNFSSLGDGSGASVEGLRSSGSTNSGATTPLKSTEAPSKSDTKEDLDEKLPITKETSDGKSDHDEPTEKSSPSPKPAASSVDADNEDLETTAEKDRPKVSQSKDVEESSDLKTTPKLDGEPAAVEGRPAEPAVDISQEAHGQGRFEVIGAPLNGMPKIHWSQLPEHFPVPTQKLIPLPTGKAKTIPKIQTSKFAEESSEQKVEREAKLDKIKKTFAFSWDGYRKNAWMQDELSPVSGDYRNPFCGWAATLVDSLDSLWMLDMKAEFEEAVQAVGKIDFTTSIRNDLPLFEVTIRYLGGLVAAYDISGSKYKILLDKAVELGEILMGAFDTPNRMPMTYYHWKPTFASQPHRAKTRVVLAEIGSLSVEFTRLAQITKEAKYYDAIARITNELETWQKNTKLPGLWPKMVDAQGCKKLESPIVAPVHRPAEGPGLHNEQSPQGVRSSKVQDADEEAGSTADKVGKEERSESDTSAGETTHQLERRQSSDSETVDGATKPKPDCIPQGLSSPPGSTWEEFTIGGMADSVYEYLPKEFMLLGGLEEKYQAMYELAADATKKHLIFRPMIEDQKRNLMVAGQVSTTGKSDGPRDWKLKAEQSHLGCFAGAMFAVGAKIFDRKDDIEVAKRLTDGCVWAYEMTATGIMPEHFLAVPCKDPDECPFNETLWYEKLDPYHPRSRIRTPASQVVLDVDNKGPPRGADTKAREADPPTDNPSSSEEGPEKTEAPASTLSKRQLGDIENDKSVPKTDDDETEDPKTISSKSPASRPKGEATADDHETPAMKKEDSVESGDDPKATAAEKEAEPVAPVVAAYTPPPIPTQEEYALTRIRDERLPKGVTKITGRKYILRPEAIESVFVMYRVTGDEYWREKGWQMFNSIQNHTRAEFGASAISDVMSETPYPSDEMESFWLAETLKYFYLLFREPDYYSLDDYVLNTEAHPFKRPKS
ncbi:MAG: hypothetical protein Q9220_002080 [cf. Caloplaca sp. 1 TL-2023]